MDFGAHSALGYLEMADRPQEQKLPDSGVGTAPISLSPPQADGGANDGPSNQTEQVTDTHDDPSLAPDVSLFEGLRVPAIY